MASEHFYCITAIPEQQKRQRHTEGKSAILVHICMSDLGKYLPCSLIQFKTIHLNLKQHFSEKAFILEKYQKQLSNFRVEIQVVTYEDNTMATASFNTLSPNKRA